MTKNRLLALLTALLMVALVLTGCGGKTETAPAAAPVAAPVVAPAPEPAPAPPVDKGAIIKEAAVAYFDAIPSNLNMIDAADLKKRVDAKDTTLVIVDIRSAADYAKSWVEGSINIPFATIGQNLDKLPKDKQIMVSCYSGQTSGQTIALLKVMGYNVLSVKGGFPSYEKAGFEIKKAS